MPELSVVPQGRPTGGWAPSHADVARVIRLMLSAVLKAREQLPFGCLHGGGRLHVGLPPRPTFHLLDRQIALQVPRYARQLAQDFPGSGIPAVPFLFLSFGVDHPLRHAARPVEIQVGVEVLQVERLHGGSVFRGDVPEADVLADDRSILHSTKALSLQCRGRDLVCSINSLCSNSATMWLMNSLPLSEKNPRMRKGNCRSRASSTGFRAASLICAVALTTSHCVTSSTALM